MNKMLHKQIERIKRKYPPEEFEERLLQTVSDSYENFEKVQKLRDRSIQLMSDELLALYKELKQKSEAYISTILGNIVDGLITCDLHGNVVTVNNAARAILNTCEEQAVGKSVVNFFSDTTSFEQLLPKLLDNQKEVMMQNSAQVAIPCELSVSKLDFYDVAYLIIFRNVTQRKEYEQTIIDEKEKAEKASKAKAEFLSVMSHEIRTPMNSIIGMANLLLDDEVNPEKQKFLDTLLFSSQHLLSLINDILDFNKIEAGKVEFERVNFDLRQLIEKILDTHRYRAHENNVNLNFSWDPGLSAQVVADPSRLNQILTNLISNAIKFTLKGSVKVLVKMVSETDAHQRIHFEVKDTGIGIPEDKLNVIFDSFSQSETYTTRKFGGTGLGLAITKQLVMLQGGEIQVTSRSGEGSSFYFELNIEKSKEKQHSIDRSDYLKELLDTKLSGLRILVAEDHPLNQVVIRKLLNKWNCDVDIVSDGDEALELIQQYSYDIVLMDLQMPNRDGFETTKAIRASGQPYQDIPIIALTASAFLEEKQRALAAGMNDFISKPFEPQSLLEKISKNFLEVGG